MRTPSSKGVTQGIGEGVGGTHPFVNHTDRSWRASRRRARLSGLCRSRRSSSGSVVARLLQCLVRRREREWRGPVWARSSSLGHWGVWARTPDAAGPGALSRPLPSADAGRLQILGPQHRLRRRRQLEPEPDPVRGRRRRVPRGQGAWPPLLGPGWGPAWSGPAGSPRVGCAR